MRRSLVAVSIAALAFPLLAACGSSGGDAASDAAGSSAFADATNTPANTPDATTDASVKCVKTATVPSASTKVGETPNITTPKGSPPCALIVKDLKVGSGAAVTDVAKPYDWNYEGVSWSTGETFDSSFTRGQAISFSLSQVIPGWTEGLQGMKPGGRRVLVIPPAKGYGAAGSPPAIGPNETLVFVVDLVGPTGS